MERIAEGASKRPIAVLMLLLAVVILGFVSLSNMYLELLPSLDYPYAIVVASYMGAGAQEIEELVIKPLEDAVSLVDGVKRFYSTAYDGLGYVFVEFEWGVDAGEAIAKLQRSVNVSRGFLPEGVNPMVVEIDPSIIPVYAFSVREEDVDRAIGLVRRVPGVSTVEVMGKPEKYIEVEIDPEQLQKYELDPSVVEYFLAGNAVYPFGQLEDGEGNEYQVSVDARFKSIKDLENLIVGFKGMKGLSAVNPGNTSSLPMMIPVRLKQIAQIRESYEEMQGTIHVDGKPQEIIAVRKRASTNTVSLIRRLRKALESEGIEYREILNQARFTERSVNNLTRNLLIGAAVASLVVLIFLRGFLPMVIIALSIPLSLTMALVLLYFFGINLDLLTLGGLTMAVGMLVDNSIVVFENIYRHLSLGKKYTEAAGKGTAEVWGAIFASTVTTAVVFVPFAFTRSFAATLFKYFAISFALALASSLLVSLLVIPAAARWIKPREWKGFERLRNWYARTLDKALNKKWIVITISLIALLTAVIVFANKPFSFMPEIASDRIQLNFKAPSQYPYTRTAELVSTVEEALLKHKDELGIETLYTEVGVTSVYSQVFGASENRATMYVMLTGPYRSLEEKRRKLVDIVQRVRPEELEVEVTSSSQELSILFGSPVMIMVYGDSLDHIKEQALKLKERLKEIPGVEEVVTSVDETREVVKLEINRNAAAVNGMLPAQVFTQLQPYTLGKNLGNVEINSEILPLKLRIKGAQTLADLPRLSFWSAIGKQIFLGMLTRMNRETLPFGIDHNMGKRVAYVEIRKITSSLGDVSREVEKVLKSPEFSDLEYEIGGQKKSLDETLGDLEFAILVAVILVFMLLAAQTESLKRPFIIFLTVPMAAVGVAFSVVVFGFPINVPVLIGALTLVGVVVNNAIVMVALIRQYQTEMNLREAVVKGARDRLRPILMSSFTTIIGLLPVAIVQAEGSQLESPIAWTVVLGLLFSMLFTLFLVPVAYEAFERKRSK